MSHPVPVVGAERHPSAATPRRAAAVPPRRGAGGPATPGDLHGDEPPGNGGGLAPSGDHRGQRDPGADTIDFAVAGTIRVGRAALPAITDTVTIDGSSAPSFAGTAGRDGRFPEARTGFRFATGADGSTLRSLSLVRAGNAGVTLDASHITVQGNYIGLLADGTTVAGNRGDGVRINASSHGDLIGQSDPVTGISYYNADGVSMQPVSGWQGIRDGDTPGQYLITGTSGANGLLYVGPISGVGGTSYAVNYPGATSTSVYGPDNLGGGVLRLVGSYKTGDGTRPRLPLPGDDRRPRERRQLPDDRLSQRDSTPTSTARWAASRSATPTARRGTCPLGTGHAFLYDVAQDHVPARTSSIPGSTTTTAYGIWYNGGTSYTICRRLLPMPRRPGPADRPRLPRRLRLGDRAVHPLDLVRLPQRAGRPGLRHPLRGHQQRREGRLHAQSPTRSRAAPTNPAQGSLVTVRRNTDGTFGPRRPGST